MNASTHQLLNIHESNEQLMISELIHQTVKQVNAIGDKTGKQIEAVNSKTGEVNGMRQSSDRISRRIEQVVDGTPSAP